MLYNGPAICNHLFSSEVGLEDLCWLQHTRHYDWKVLDSKRNCMQAISDEARRSALREAKVKRWHFRSCCSLWSQAGQMKFKANTASNLGVFHHGCLCRDCNWLVHPHKRRSTVHIPNDGRLFLRYELSLDRPSCWASFHPCHLKIVYWAR